MERGETDLSRFLKDKASSDEGISAELIMYYWMEMLMAVKSIHDNSKYLRFLLNILSFCEYCKFLHKHRV